MKMGTLFSIEENSNDRSCRKRKKGILASLMASIMGVFLIIVMSIPAYANIYGKVEGNYCKVGPATNTSRVFLCEGLPKGMLTTDISLYLHEFGIPNDWADPGGSYEIEVLVRAEIYYNPDASKPFATIYTNWGIRDYDKQDIWGGLWWTYPLNFNLLLQNVPLYGKVKISIFMTEYDNNFNNPNDTIMLDDKSCKSSLDVDVYPDKGIYRHKKFIKFAQKEEVEEKPKSCCRNDNCVEGNKISFTVTKYNKSSVCHNYAKESVKQNNEASRFYCGFKPPSWSSDYNKHYNWCIHGKNTKYIATSIQKRNTELQDCKDIYYKKKKKICKKYAKASVQQATTAKKLNCPFDYKTPMWRGNNDEYFVWCLQGDNYKKAADNVRKQGEKIKNCNTTRSPGLLGTGQMVGTGASNNKTTQPAVSAEPYCKIYAQDATTQYHTSQQRQCGFGGPGWSPNYNEHYNWCMATYKKGDLIVIANEMARRNVMLSNCK